MSEDGIDFNGFSVTAWFDEFKEATSLTRREAKKVLYAGAKQIMKDSQTMCPVDEHNLEQAHKIEEVRLNMDYTQLKISVGGVVNGRDTDEYAMIQHEGLAPRGSGTAGVVQPFIAGDPDRPSASYAKSENNPPNMPVGGKFLETAIAMNEEAIVNGIKETLPSNK